MPDISVPALNTNTIRTYLVRILHLRYKTTCFPWKNEGSGTTLATHWTTHQGPRQRTRRRSTCRHGHAWIGRKAKAIGQKCEKPWENQGFLAERTGTELLAVFPMLFKSSKGTMNWLLDRGAISYADPFCAANLALARLNETIWVRGERPPKAKAVFDSHSA